MARVRSDTRRLLLLLQLVHRRPGMRLDRLARTLNQSERDVLRDLERLSLCGIPPFTPDDYLDAYVERGRVYVRGANGFRGATRFTSQEAVSLLAALRYLEQSGGGPGAFPAGRSAARKIEEALSGDTRGAMSQLSRRVSWEAGAGADASTFAAVRQALADQCALDATYYSESADEMHTGRVRPYDLVFARGHWYLIAWSEARGEIRTLRVDRIQVAAPTRERYEIPSDFRPSDYVTPSMMRATSAGAEVTMRVDPPLAEFASEEYAAAKAQSDESVVVTFRATKRAWAARQALRWAPCAEVLAPPEARDATAAMARDLADRSQRRRAPSS